MKNDPNEVVERRSPTGEVYYLHVAHPIQRPRGWGSFAPFDLPRDYPQVVAIVDPDNPSDYLLMNKADVPEDATLWPDQSVVPKPPI